MQTRNGLVALFAALTALLVAVPFAWAHGGDDGLIHSCVKNGKGDLRIVEPDEACKNSEYPLDWSASTAAGEESGGTILDTGLAQDCVLSTTPSLCVQRSLPSGSWLLTYRGVIEHDAAIINGNFPACDLLVDGVVIDAFAGRVAVNGGNIVMISTVSAESVSIVEVRCSVSLSAGNLKLETQRLIAQQFANVAPWAP